MPSPAPPLAPIPKPDTIDDVVEAIDSIIGWSIEAVSPLGYFAALYKRITIAVRTAIAQGLFQQGERMQRLDVTFAARYLDAVNAHFHPRDYRGPTQSWRVAFDALADPKPIVLQHILAGVSAHISLDLGIAAATVAPGPRLPGLHDDFNTINAVLAGQVNGILDALGGFSPTLADIHQVLKDHEIFVINEAIRTLRDGAWTFATVLALQLPLTWPATIWIRDRQVADRAGAIYHPPGLVGVLQAAVDAIAARESRDIVGNIRILDQVAQTPAPLSTSL
jgi:Family of unknown function (DUF5995)